LFSLVIPPRIFSRPARLSTLSVVSLEVRVVVQQVQIDVFDFWLLGDTHVKLSFLK
jgi:hypothetical protein